MGTVYERPLADGGELLIEWLADQKKATQKDYVFEVLIVGSGYGGSVAAARLTEGIKRTADGKIISVCVLERGLEHLPGTFPSRLADLPGHVRINRYDTPEFTGDAAALFDIRIGEDVSVLLGNGLGGGSLINASVAEEPEPEVFQSSHWPAELRIPNVLKDHFCAARKALGVRAAEVRGIVKYEQFAAWAKRLELEVEPAKVAVHFSDTSDNGHCVQQHHCVNCGDCFTGCNFHAKNTLPMNYLARAKRNGASLYTGVTVSRLEQGPDATWIVKFRLTPRPGFTSWQREEHAIRARHVVLAAGALGSTEILLRSRSKQLPFSLALGSRFSCNGDMIGSVYAQDAPVNACAPESLDQYEREVGPTITGIARTRGARKQRFVIEELAVPAALRRVFEEVVTTAGLPYKLGGFDSAFSFNDGIDQLAVDCKAVDSTQVLAAMGEDGAGGKLDLIEVRDTHDKRKTADGLATVIWKGAALDPLYAQQDEVMKRRTAGGGEYLRSPLWQPLPPEMAARLGGEKPKGKLFTVHPLGGCPMADDATTGVVNHIGQVFSGSSGKHNYGNLLILDGSIVPTALGINPLLTITALAERAIKAHIDHNVRQGIWQQMKVSDHREPETATTALKFKPLPPREEQPTALRFAEQVQGDLQLGSKHETRLALHFEAVPDVPGFLRNGSRKLILPDGKLTVIPHGQKEDQAKTARIKGEVVLLQQCGLSAFERTFTALLAFLWRRGIADWLQDRRKKSGRNYASAMDIVWGILLWTLTPLFAFGAGLGAAIGCLFWPLWLRFRKNHGERADAITHWIEQNAPWLVFIPLAYQIGEARRLRYDLELQGDLQLESGLLRRGTRIKGEKILRYTLTSNPWRQLFQLPVKIIEPRKLLPKSGTLNVDLDYFFRRYATQLQITQQRDLPSGLVDLASTVLLLLRLVGKVHFWSFRLPEYQPCDKDLLKHRTPGELPGMQCKPYEVGGEPKLRVTHYSAQPNGEPPVVLFHGLGASGNQFATPKLDTNLVQHLVSRGRDVWVAELRHSIALPKSPDQQWTLDQIALGDVPRIIAKVKELTPARQVDVVAHCIGSAMFCTATLAGRLQGEDGKSWVRSAVLMQVGPLITLSPGTKIRAYLAAFLRRYVQASSVDFSVDEGAKWLDSLVDRVLATYPYPSSEARHHRLVPPWEPHRHEANCNRWAAIDGRMLQHANLDQRMLDSLGEILGHANLRTWEQTIQYAYAERLTDFEALNYVTDENIRKYFQFPVRFIHGSENDVFSVRTSRRSCQLLKQVLGENACDLVELPGYSHLDPLIGKNACCDVYPHISEFLSERPTLNAVKPRPLREMRLPLIGPVVGWTRRDSGRRWVARIWCRIDDTCSPPWYVLVITRKADGQSPRRLKTFKPYAGQIDTLAVFDIELEADDADYEIFVASVHLSGPQQTKTGDLRLLDQQWTSLIALPEVDKAMFQDDIEARADLVLAKSAKASDACTTDPDYDEPLYRALLRKRMLGDALGKDGFRFALASCRYGASVIDRERADALFGSVRRLIEGTESTDVPSLLLLVGDQIYADQTAGVFDPLRRRERFYEAYREAWTAPNARAVLSQVPTYMMMDDHEIEDNWHPKDKVVGDEGRLRHQGLVAFQEYQLLHSPGHKSLSAVAKPRDWPLGQPMPDFWYAFTAADFPFFVMDTRSGREVADRIMTEQQMAEFGEWLQRCDKERPKFVVSPSVVVPFRSNSGPESAYASRSDGWDGYRQSLCELFRHIRRAKANNVVFLCGDAHLSMASTISFISKSAEEQSGLRSYCVVSSGLYAPFPFANSRCVDYLHANGSRPFEIDPGIYMHYKVLPKSWEERNNFTMVHVELVEGNWKIKLRQYGERGEPKEIELSSARGTTKPVKAEPEHVCRGGIENRITG